MIRKTTVAIVLVFCITAMSQVAYAESESSSSVNTNQEDRTTEPGGTGEDHVTFDDGIAPTPLPDMEEIESAVPTELMGVVGASSEINYPLNHYASLVPQPKGYVTNSCWKSVLSASANLYICRNVVKTTKTIAKNDSKIVGSSKHHPTYGTMVVHSGGTYEGCNTYYGRYWRCSFAADQHWSRQTSTNLNSNYYYKAFKEVKLIPKIKCALGFYKVWRGTATTVTANKLPKDCVSGAFG